MNRTRPTLCAAALLWLMAAPASHANPFPDADLAVGGKMHAEMCVECHAKRFDGPDGSGIYTRFERRVGSADALAQQLTACTTMLNLDLFPEDEQHIAGYLNKHYYQFK